MNYEQYIKWYDELPPDKFDEYEPVIKNRLRRDYERAKLKEFTSGVDINVKFYDPDEQWKKLAGENYQWPIRFHY